MSDNEDYSSESDNEIQPRLKIGKTIKAIEADDIAEYSDAESDQAALDSDAESGDDHSDDGGEYVETHEQLDRGIKAREGDEEPMDLEGYNEGISDYDEDGEHDDDDDDDDDDGEYLQKFDKNIQKKVIEEFHPDLQVHNNEEIETLCKIVRDANGRIIDPFHKTSSFITRYEKARILGERAKQINAGAEPFVEIEPHIMDGYLIALKEFEQKKLPFIIQRPLPNGACEYWRLSDLEIL
jgi:DNA-directed RNA polymerase I, II, and III subunit RPABC2